MVHAFSTTRRVFIAGLGAVTVVGPKTALAQPSTRPKLLLVILRGALDGLAAVPKLDDPHIEGHRAALIDRNARPIANGFALHSALKTFHRWYQSGEAGVVHAVAGPWRDRSHFLAQDLLESGSVASASTDGWINRMLQVRPDLSAISIGPAKPLILSGAATASSWSPAALPQASDDTIRRLMVLYDSDPILGSALTSALETDTIASGMGEMTKSRGDNGFGTTLVGAARLLAAQSGPDIAVASLSGWDTHTRQNAVLARRLGHLDSALASARTALGEAWAHTAILCVTEFGRTVRINGGGGSDHGTAGAALIAGGAVKGGKVWGDWPGLSPAALHDNRDLAPATDMTSLFKGLLSTLYGCGQGELNAVFPEVRAAPVMRFA